MPLLNTYKNPKANTLYGAGNSKLTRDEIRNFITAPGRTDAEIEGAALYHNVNRDQIVDAGAGIDRFSGSNVDRYLTDRGITKDRANVVTAAPVTGPKAVKPTAINVGTNDTVQGRMNSLLTDQNNPLNVQARTIADQAVNRRGLLNSSIGISAGQDAMMKNAMPIATQDAATYYDAKKTNSGQDLQAGMFNNEMGAKIGMFNADLGSKVGMFNSDQASREGMFDRQQAQDYTMHRENNALNKYVADMDNDSKLAIANLELMATETGVMGDMGKTLMNLYQQTAADDSLSTDMKNSIFSTLRGIQEDIGSYMPTFQKAGKNLVFSPSTTEAGTIAGGSATGGSDTGKKPDGSGKTSGLAPTPGMNNNIGDVGTVKPNSSGDGFTAYLYGSAKDPRPVQVDSSDYKLTGAEKTGIERYNRDNGLNIDINDVIPSEFINELQRQGQMFGLHYDPNWFGVPVQPPGTMRTDSPAYYVWKPAAAKYMG